MIVAKHPRFSAVIGIVLTIVTLYLAQRGLDLAKVWESFQRVRWGFVLLAGVSLVLTNIVKSERWRCLLLPRPPLRTLGVITEQLVIGQAVNLLLPARLGEIARTFLIDRRLHRGKVYLLGTIAAEKMIDMLALAALVVSMLPLGVMPAWLNARVAPIALSAILAAAVILGLIVARHRLAAMLDDATRRTGWRWLIPWNRRVLAGVEGLSALSQRSIVVSLTLLTVASWFLSAATNWLLFLAFGLPGSPLAACFLLVVLQTGVAVPSTPGRIGVFHYLCVLALSVFAVPAPQALSYAIGLHILVVGGTILWGALGLARQSLSLAGIGRAAAEWSR
jgi:glycosyltransferase 2 family protein